MFCIFCMWEMVVSSSYLLYTFNNNIIVSICFLTFIYEDLSITSSIHKSTHQYILLYAIISQFEIAFL